MRYQLISQLRFRQRNCTIETYCVNTRRSIDFVDSTNFFPNAGKGYSGGLMQSAKRTPWTRRSERKDSVLSFPVTEKTLKLARVRDETLTHSREKTFPSITNLSSFLSPSRVNGGAARTIKENEGCRTFVGVYRASWREGEILAENARARALVFANLSDSCLRT